MDTGIFDKACEKLMLRITSYLYYKIGSLVKSDYIME
jgi:hypothetical protein